jgi:hypothetical protein
MASKPLIRASPLAPFLAIHVVAIRLQSKMVTVLPDYANLVLLPRNFQLPDASEF